MDAHFTARRYIRALISCGFRYLVYGVVFFDIGDDFNRATFVHFGFHSQLNWKYEKWPITEYHCCFCFSVLYLSSHYLLMTTRVPVICAKWMQRIVLHIIYLIYWEDSSTLKFRYASSCWSISLYCFVWQSHEKNSSILKPKAQEMENEEYLPMLPIWTMLSNCMFYFVSGTTFRKEFRALFAQCCQKNMANQFDMN